MPKRILVVAAFSWAHDGHRVVEYQGGQKVTLPDDAADYAIAERNAKQLPDEGDVHEKPVKKQPPAVLATPEQIKQADDKVAAAESALAAAAKGQAKAAAGKALADAKRERKALAAAPENK